MRQAMRRRQKIRVLWDVFAYFPCNASGVRVGVRGTRAAAMRLMDSFTRKNRVDTSARIRLEGTIA